MSPWLPVGGPFALKHLVTCKRQQWLCTGNETVVTRRSSVRYNQHLLKTADRRHSEGWLHIQYFPERHSFPARRLITAHVASIKYLHASDRQPANTLQNITQTVQRLHDWIPFVIAQPFLQLLILRKMEMTCNNLLRPFLPIPPDWINGKQSAKWGCMWLCVWRRCLSP